MGDIVVQQNVSVSKTEIQMGRQKEGSQPEMTKGLKGGEERWRDNG